MNSGRHRSRTIGNIRRFIRRHGRLISTTGALIVFLTFVPKEGLRDYYKDLSRKLSGEQTQFLITHEFFTLERTLNDVQGSFAHRSDKSSGPAPKTSAAEVDESLMLALELDNLWSVAGTADGANTLGSYESRYEAISQRLFGPGPWPKMAEIVGNSPDDSYQKLSFEIQEHIRDLLEPLKREKERAEDRLVFYTRAGYVLYTLGWLLAFLPQILGIKVHTSSE